MTNACDLHTHSIYSDGTCTPEEILEQAAAMGLSAVALTDHNTVSGLPSFLKAAEKWPVEAVPGIEISAGYGKKEVHLLGLFLPRWGWDMLQEEMTEINRRKDESNRQLVAALQEAGYPLDYEQLISQTPDHHINRGHIGAALVEMGRAESIREAVVYGVLSEKGGFYHPPQRLTAKETMALILRAGGKPVLAHPFLNLSEGELRCFLQEAKGWGLIGMETSYPLYDAETTELAEKIAGECGLLRSGGSDFHGAIKPDIALGKGRGDLRVPNEYFLSLKAAEAPLAGD